jgi:hypothetical protein
VSCDCNKQSQRREEVPGKTERTKEDALPERDRTTWLTVVSKSAIDKVILDPDVWPEGAT